MTFVSYVISVEFISNPYMFYMIYFVSIGLFFLGLVSIKDFLNQTFITSSLIRIWLDLENAFLFFMLISFIFAKVQSPNFILVLIILVGMTVLTLLSLYFTDQKIDYKLILWGIMVAFELTMLIIVLFDMISALYILVSLYWAFLLLLHMKMNGVRSWKEFLLPLILFLSLLFFF